MDARPWDSWADWYDIVEVGDDSLRQGDIVRSLAVFAPAQSIPVHEKKPVPGESITVQGEWDYGDWIVMSASCDVGSDSDHYPHVLIAKAYPATADQFGIKKPKKLDEVLEAIRRGLDFHRFLLAEHPTLGFPRSFVEFRPHLTMPLEYLKRACKTQRRLRLESPFREQFGNWVGANFSRVGIEDDEQMPPYKTGTSAAALLALDELVQQPRIQTNRPPDLQHQQGLRHSIGLVLTRIKHALRL